MKIMKSKSWREAIHSVTDFEAGNLFWNLESEEFGITLTDDSGNFLLTNLPFDRQILKVTSPTDFSSIIHRYLNSPLKSSHQVIDTGEERIKLSLEPLHGHCSGASFLWVISNNEKNLARQKTALLKNLYKETGRRFKKVCGGD